MLNDRQSLILCGLIAGGIFVSGIIEILDNYIVKTVLAVLFLLILINLFFSSKPKEEKEQEEKHNDLK